MIKGEQLSWTYKAQKKPTFLLKEVSFQLRQGRITTFMGQSGAGKTTLLKCIANLHDEYEGLLTCQEQDLKTMSPATRASTVGCVLQQFHLFPHLTVLKNCTYALVSTLRLQQGAAEERAAATLAALGMENYLSAYPSQLSGGQQQRVAIARALVLRPAVLLLDEPTSALDPDSKKHLETLLLDLNRQGMTIALSSHDMPFIQKVMDYIYFMEQGQLIEEWDRHTEALSSKEKIKQFLSPG